MIPIYLLRSGYGGVEAFIVGKRQERTVTRHVVN